MIARMREREDGKMRECESARLREYENARIFATEHQLRKFTSLTLTGVYLSFTPVHQGANSLRMIEAGASLVIVCTFYWGTVIPTSFAHS